MDAFCPAEDPRQLLRAWAWGRDLDPAERSAALACDALGAELGGEPARLAWQAVAALGHRPGAAALRKLRRAAMARLLARDLRGEVAWSSPGAAACDSLARAAEALERLAEAGRCRSLWSSLEAASALPGFEPGEPALGWALRAGLGSPPWTDAGARGASALSDFDWEGGAEEDSRRAARAWALLERDELASSSEGSSSCGGAAGAKRL